MTRCFPSLRALATGLVAALLVLGAFVFLTSIVVPSSVQARVNQQTFREDTFNGGGGLIIPVAGDDDEPTLKGRSSRKGPALLAAESSGVQGGAYPFPVDQNLGFFSRIQQGWERMGRTMRSVFQVLP